MVRGLLVKDLKANKALPKKQRINIDNSEIFPYKFRAYDDESDLAERISELNIAESATCPSRD